MGVVARCNELFVVGVIVMVHWVEFSLFTRLRCEICRHLASVPKIGIYGAPYGIFLNKFIVSDIPHVQWKVVRLE